MRIHYYMQYFPGADAVGARQPYAFSRYLANRGHDVTVVASNRNIDTPKKEIALRFSGNQRGRLRVLRLPCLPGGRGRNIPRLCAYSSFMMAAFMRGCVLPRADVILGSIQPVFTGVAAREVARLRRVPFVLEVRDLWPDALLVKNALTSAQAKPLFALTNYLYRNAARIISITPGIKKELLKKGISPSRVDVFPNGLDTELFAGQHGVRDDVRRKYGWRNDFVAVYVGSFTQVTGMDVIVRAAAELKGAGIRFELFGSGPTLNDVRQLANRLEVDNITFHKPVPKMQVPALLAAADVGLMSLFKTPLAHIYFENKFIDYMGAGIAIFAAMEGEQADVIKRFCLGRVVGPGDVSGLARCLRDASFDAASLSAMGARGKSLVYQGLLLPDIMRRYAETLEAAANGTLDSCQVWEPEL